MKNRERLLELMLYREAGGRGYDLAINRLAENTQEFHKGIEAKLKGIKEREQLS